MRKSPTNLVEMVGKTFGRLTVLSRDGVSKEGKAMWRCRCDCGTVSTHNGKLIRDGTTNSCGCLVHERSSKFVDLVGKRFGILTVLKYVDNNTSNRRVSRFLVRCDCGVEKIVIATVIKKSKSCGCLTNELIRKEHMTHGDTIGGRTKEYRAWKSIKDRCYLKTSKNYKNWGGRGITMCKKWRASYEPFLEYMGRAPSKLHQVERPKNMGNYGPGNAIWALPKVQSRNRRTNVYATHKGEKLCALDWSIKLKMKYWTVIRRIKAGWSIARIKRHYGV